MGASPFPEAIVNLSRMTLYDLCISHPECQHVLGGKYCTSLCISVSTAALIYLFISHVFSSKREQMCEQRKVEN